MKVKVNIPESCDIDLDEILRGNRLIAHIWGVEDVQEIRPDLDDDQAWQVLQTIDRSLDSELGVSWETIENAAGQFFGPRRQP